MLKINLENLKTNVIIYNINKNIQYLNMSGRFGVIKRYVRKEIKLIIKDNYIYLKPLFFCKEIKTLLQNYFFVLKNIITDINYGYLVILEVRGVGYKVFSKSGLLTFNLGYSHRISFELPKNIISKVLDEKNTIFYLMGNNKHDVMFTALKICSLKNKDPYKGKGIYFFSQNLKLKEGKGKKKV